MIDFDLDIVNNTVTVAQDFWLADCWPQGAFICVFKDNHAMGAPS